MRICMTRITGASAAAFLVAASPLWGQSPGESPDKSPDPGAKSAQPAEASDASPGETAIDPDAMADLLNSRQQIQQSFTFTRKIDGEVVETDKRTITYSRDDPLRPTEAGHSALEALQETFDREVLTRTEAYDEAKLDFALADKNRDHMMDADEFAGLVQIWRENGSREAVAPDEETARQRQYRAFIEEFDPEGARQDAIARAKQRFSYMAGVSPTLSWEDYLREYLLDFDSMDANGDGLLKGEELMMFRALNRGETIATHSEEMR